MVPCNTMTDPKFLEVNPTTGEEGIWYKELGSTNTFLCPSVANIDYSGTIGTNLWMMPKGETTNGVTTYPILTDATPYREVNVLA